MFNQLFTSLGGTLIAEELKGDFRRAQAEIGTVATPTAEARLQEAVVRLLGGEANAAITSLNEAEGLARGDAGLLLRITSWRLLARSEQFNTFPDGAAANAVEVSARWDAVGDMREPNSRYQLLLGKIGDVAALGESWLAYQFLFRLKPVRYMLQNFRYGPPTPRAEQILQQGLNDCEHMRQQVLSGAVPATADFAFVAAPILPTDRFFRPLPGDSGRAGPVAGRRRTTV